MQENLFDARSFGLQEAIAPGALLLREFAASRAEEILAAIQAISTDNPFRQLRTPGGQRMSVALCNAGRFGWHSDEAGYRYLAHNPSTGRAWPAIPDALIKLAQSAAEAAGYSEFSPQACLINRYAPGAKMALHQDKDERNFAAPIVSISLGLPATFLWGGLQRNDRAQKLPLVHGDVLVWGGPSRLRFHGIAPIIAGQHPLTGALRYNLTLRRVTP